MTHKITIELFKFNSKNDYLPYYKEYEISCKGEDTILDMLNNINKIESFNYVNSKEFNIKINDFFVNVDTKVSQLLKLTSSHIKIEPISIFRVTDDLIINRDDYIAKVEFFSEYLSRSEIDDCLVKHELDYYASNSYNINRDYVGDSSLLIAMDIMQKQPETKDAIMKFISNYEDGIWYHTSLQNRVFNYDTQKEIEIQNLLSELLEAKNIDIQKTIKSDKKSATIAQYFDGFNIASYDGLEKDRSDMLIDESKASYIELALKNEDLAPHSVIVNKDFSMLIAGEILLQAKDNNADFLIVRDMNDLNLFDTQQASISKLMGREIDLPVISKGQFIQVLDGEKDRAVLGFDNHKIDVSFL